MTRVLLLILLVFSSCGYRFDRGSLGGKSQTVNIPFVEGDNLGLLTNALIRVMTKRGAFSYTSTPARFVLQVSLLEPIDRNIGFTLVLDEEKNERTIVASNEARLILTARFSLKDCSSGACVIGPCELSTSLDFDFEPDLSTVSAQAFALGQLEMHNLAQDEVFASLCNLLAEKIVDYITYYW